jgi:integrase/recombinase XerD
MGRRDHALLMLMAAYGLRAGEALQLRVEDVDFRGSTLRVRRSKTGMETILPLLPSVARALLEYLLHGRPRRTMSREVFLRARAPFRSLSGAGAVGYVLRKHAEAAGVWAPFLGSHVLRHSHASRQVEAGVSLKAVGDILGHADPESTSVYIRLPSRRLRTLALPVPR